MILLLSLGLSSSTADAQAPLISSGNFFQIDRSYLYKYKIDTSLWAVSPGNGGANIVWDYSSLDFSEYFTIDTTVSVAPAGTSKFLACGISGPDTANLCLVNKSMHFYRTDDYQYCKMHGGIIKTVGKDQDNGVVEDINFTYTRQPVYSLMPFTYLDRATDSFRGSYYSYLSGMHYIKGTDSIIADGYGTLRIDGSLYNNCVRLKHTTHKTDSNNIRGVSHTGTITYTWYSAQKEGPVLEMEKNMDTVFGNKISVACYYFPSSQTGAGNFSIEEISVTVRPVPATDHLIVSLKNKSLVAGPVKFQLINSYGAAVYEKELNSKETELNISMLPAGTYWYKILGRNNIASGLITKE